MQSFSRFKATLTTVILTCLSLFAMAQPPGPGPSPDPAVPIDLGLTAFVAAGLGYAIKKRRDKKKADLEERSFDK